MNSVLPENLNFIKYNQQGSLNATNKLFKFEPPLYIQRYEYVSRILLKNNCKTFLDVGCSECGFLSFLKNTNHNLNLIVGLDIDQILLKNACEKLWIDYNQRKNPLELYLIKGIIF